MANASAIPSISNRFFLFAGTAIICFLASCSWFSSPRSTSIRGKWVIDSFAYKGDSLKAPMALLLLAMATDDSTKQEVQIGEEYIVLTEGNDKPDSLRFRQLGDELQLLDSSNQRYRIEQEKDRLRLYGSDSIVLYLHRR